MFSVFKVKLVQTTIVEITKSLLLLNDKSYEITLGKLPLPE